MKALEITLRGMVQGVFMRKFIEDKATLLGLTGYVKNMNDGTVFCHIEGVEQSLGAFIELMRKGPPGARVDDMTSQEIPVRGFHNFTIK